MIVMLNRPALQRQELQRASTQTRVYSAWAADNFYVAFSLQGIAEGLQHHAQNFVTYKDRRAWGEDLCEILVQPVYSGDNPLGTVLHIVCKPNGGVWVERKLDERLNVRSWEVIEDAAVRYATTTPGGGEWRGELAIPWKLIGDPTRGLPALLRFNFVQHNTSSGETQAGAARSTSAGITPLWVCCSFARPTARERCASFTGTSRRHNDLCRDVKAESRVPAKGQTTSQPSTSSKRRPDPVASSCLLAAIHYQLSIINFVPAHPCIEMLASIRRSGAGMSRDFAPAAAFFLANWSSSIAQVSR